MRILLSGTEDSKLLISGTSDALLVSGMLLHGFTITANPEKVKAIVPVLVFDLRHAPEELWYYASEDGSDILVFDAAYQRIPTEVVGYDRVAKTGQVYFRPTSMVQEAENIFHVQYGSGISVDAEDPLGKHAVWKDFAFVYHFDSSYITSTDNSGFSGTDGSDPLEDVEGVGKGETLTKDEEFWYSYTQAVMSEARPTADGFSIIAASRFDTTELEPEQGPMVYGFPASENYRDIDNALTLQTLNVELNSEGLSELGDAATDAVSALASALSTAKTNLATNSNAEYSTSQADVVFTGTGTSTVNGTVANVTVSTVIPTTGHCGSVPSVFDEVSIEILPDGGANYGGDGPSLSAYAEDLFKNAEDIEEVLVESYEEAIAAYVVNPNVTSTATHTLPSGEGATVSIKPRSHVDGSVEMDISISYYPNTFIDLTELLEEINIGGIPGDAPTEFKTLMAEVIQGLRDDPNKFATVKEPSVDSYTARKTLNNNYDQSIGVVIGPAGGFISISSYLTSPEGNLSSAYNTVSGALTSTATLSGKYEDWAYSGDYYGYPDDGAVFPSGITFEATGDTELQLKQVTLKYVPSESVDGRVDLEFSTDTMFTGDSFLTFSATSVSEDIPLSTVPTTLEDQYRYEPLGIPEFFTVTGALTQTGTVNNSYEGFSTRRSSLQMSAVYDSALEDHVVEYTYSLSPTNTLKKVRANTPISPDTIHQHSFAYNSTGVRAYMDGVSVGENLETTTSGLQILVDGLAAVNIGRFGCNDFNIDAPKSGIYELWIYNGYFTGNQITTFKNVQLENSTFWSVSEDYPWRVNLTFKNGGHLQDALQFLLKFGFPLIEGEHQQDGSPLDIKFSFRFNAGEHQQDGHALRTPMLFVADGSHLQDGNSLRISRKLETVAGGHQQDGVGVALVFFDNFSFEDGQHQQTGAGLTIRFGDIPIGKEEIYTLTVRPKYTCTITAQARHMYALVSQ